MNILFLLDSLYAFTHLYYYDHHIIISVFVSNFSSNLDTDPCPDDYTLAPNGRCYLFVQSSLGSFWHYSRETCWAQKDSDLAIINDQEELDFIVQQIAAIGDSKNWWLGTLDAGLEWVVQYFL